MIENKNIKTILKKRAKINRESKKGFIKRKVVFKEKKNEEKYYYLTDLEIYEKRNALYKIERSRKNIN